MLSPLITVVTVVRNGNDTIEKTILSVIKQTYQNTQYIIIDGASDDGTTNIIKKYEDKIDKWISEPDSGIYDAMNKGLAFANGDWIVFMNGGDQFADQHTLEFIVSQAEHDADILFGDCIADYGRFKKYIKAGTIDELWKGTQFSHQSTVMKTQLLKEEAYQCQYRICADFDFIFRQFISGKKFKYLPVPISVFEAFGISHSKMFDSVKEQYQIVRKYKPLTYHELLYHYVKLTKVYVEVFIRNLLPKRIYLYLAGLGNRKNHFDNTLNK